MTLNMGNGEHTAAKELEHVKNLLGLFEQLSGIQQLPLGPNAASDE